MPDVAQSSDAHGALMCPVAEAQGWNRPPGGPPFCLWLADPWTCIGGLCLHGARVAARSDAWRWGCRSAVRGLWLARYHGRRWQLLPRGPSMNLLLRVRLLLPRAMFAVGLVQRNRAPAYLPSQRRRIV